MIFTSRKQNYNCIVRFISVLDYGHPGKNVLTIRRLGLLSNLTRIPNLTQTHIDKYVLRAMINVPHTSVDQTAVVNTGFFLLKRVIGEIGQLEANSNSVVCIVNVKVAVVRLNAGESYKRQQRTRPQARIENSVSNDCHNRPRRYLKH